MQIKVGIVGQQNVTCTLYLDPVMDHKELENVTEKNCVRVGTAIARKTLETNVFPIDIHL